MPIPHIAVIIVENSSVLRFTTGDHEHDDGRRLSVREFDAVVAHCEGDALPGRLQALECGHGVMRIALDASGP